MTVIDAGDLRAELTLQRPNGEDGSYADVETVWANIRLASGSETLRFGAALSVQAYVVTIYFRTDVQASWLLTNQTVSPNRSLQIASFGDPDGEQNVLQLLCLEVN